MSMRTPLKTVRYLGSAKEGTDHFWRQRVTGAANALLSLAIIALGIHLAGADYTTVKRTLANPFVALALLLFVTSATIHMRIGMQVIIEDYVHGEAAKIVLLVLNTFFAIVVGAGSALAILKLSFGA